MWSDGTTVWVAPQGTANLSAGLQSGETSECSSGASCVLAYDMSGQRRPQRDIPTSASPWRLWSDGATLWVGSGVNDSVTGYDLAAGESVSARDLTVRVAEDGAAPISVKGLWSDGVSLWVGLDVFAPIQWPAKARICGCFRWTAPAPAHRHTILWSQPGTSAT